MSGELRFGLRLLGSQLLTSLVAFAFAAFLAARLLMLDAAAAEEAHRGFLVGFFVHALVLTLGAAREIKLARGLFRALSLGLKISATETFHLYRVSMYLSGFALLGAVISALVIALVPLGAATVPASVRGSFGLFGFTALLGFHLAGYVALRQIVGQVLTRVDPGVAGRASRVHALTLQRTGTIALRVALGVGLSVYFVAQGALLQTGAHVRAALDAQRREIARDLDTVMAMGPPEVRAAIEPKARAAGMSQAGAPTAPSLTIAGAPAPLSGRSGFALVVFVIAFVASASALLAGAGLGRSYARALSRAAEEIRSMGDDAPGVRVELLDTSRYRDVTDLLFAVGELGHLFQRFAIAQNTAAASNVRTERMRAQFLTSMSHDLKAPMNAVLGFAELLSRHHLTAGQAENVQIVKQRGEELMLLIQTVLDSARLEAESFVMDASSQSLEGLMREAVQKAAELGSDHDVEIVCELHEEHEIVVDPERLTFAFLLLLRTAQRLTSPGLEVQVRAGGHRSLGIVELIIESSGGALAPAELSRMFEAFHYTAEARKFGSLGLGLSLAQSIIALSRGTIDISAADSGALRIAVKLPTPRDTDPSLM